MSRAVMQKAMDALESFQKISEFTPALAVHAIADLRAELAKPERTLTDEEIDKLMTAAARYRKLVAMEAELVEPITIWHYLRNPDDLDTAHNTKEKS